MSNDFVCDNRRICFAADANPAAANVIKFEMKCMGCYPYYIEGGRLDDHVYLPLFSMSLQDVLIKLHIFTVEINKSTN